MALGRCCVSYESRNEISQPVNLRLTNKLFFFSLKKKEKEKKRKNFNRLPCRCSSGAQRQIHDKETKDKEANTQHNLFVVET